MIIKNVKMIIVERKHKQVKNTIFFIERNIHGAWVVYGTEGVKQYYEYTKVEASKKYIEECKTIIAQR